MRLTPDEQHVALELVQHVVTTRGQGVDWLDDDDRAAISEAMDSDAPGVERFRRVVDVIDRKITQDIVANFIREGRLL